MAERKSTIPPNAQVPAALVLGAVFLALLWFRFAPGGDEGARKEVAVSQTNYSLDEVRLLVEEVRGEELVLTANDNTISECAGDPFLWDALAPVEPVVALPEEPDTEWEDAMEERRERLAALHLSGTMFIGRTGIAVINGKQFRAGEEIEGFTLNHIDERSAVLVDEYGAEELEIRFESLLPISKSVGAGQ